MLPLKNFMVREYQSTKYLLMAKEGSEIIPIEDIGAVAEQRERNDELWVINNVTVAGVPYFDTYKSCLQCKARVEPHTDYLGKCSKMDCMMMQRFDLCPQHTTPKLMLLYDDDGEQRTVFAFAYGETVHQIAGGDDVSVEGLTESGTFKSIDYDSFLKTANYKLGKVKVLRLPGLKALVPGSSGVVGPYPLFHASCSPLHRG